MQEVIKMSAMRLPGSALATILRQKDFFGKKKFATMLVSSSEKPSCG